MTAQDFTTHTEKWGVKNVTIVNFKEAQNAYSIPDDHVFVRRLDTQHNWFSLIRINDTAAVVIADISSVVEVIAFYPSKERLDKVMDELSKKTSPTYISRVAVTNKKALSIFENIFI